MDEADPFQTRIERLRKWRNQPEPDLSMRFLPKHFKDSVERPFRQVTSVTELWHQLLPPELMEHTQLQSLRRGVLRVRVDSSARLYELDRLLRTGLEQELIHRHKGPALRRIELRVTDDLFGESK